MTAIETIRTLDAQGVSQREIAKRTRLARGTVAKYANENDFSPRVPARNVHDGVRVLAGLTEIIEGWLVDDERRPRK